MKLKKNSAVSRGVKRVSGVAGRVVLASLPLFGVSAFNGAMAEDIVVALEEPADGAIATGVSNLRGWAVGKFGIERVELLIDGEYRFDLPYGGKRKDVGGSYDYPDDDNSGFSMAFMYSRLEPGEHTITVRAWDRYFNYQETESTFEVVRFGDGSWVDGMDLSQASAAIDGNDVVLINAMLNEEPYNMRLRWVTQTQQPEIVDINGFDLSSMLDVDGNWDIETTTDETECGGKVRTDPYFALPVSTEGYTLDFNGLEMIFAGVDPETGGVMFEATQGFGGGDIAWEMTFVGDAMTGSGSRDIEADDCTVSYALSGSKVGASGH